MASSSLVCPYFGLFYGQGSSASLVCPYFGLFCLVASMVLMLSELVFGCPVIFEGEDDVTPYEPWL